MRSGSIWLEIGVSLGSVCTFLATYPKTRAGAIQLWLDLKMAAGKLEYVATKAIGQYYTFRVRYSESSKGRIAILADRYSLGDLKIGGFLRECESVFAATEDEAEKGPMLEAAIDRYLELLQQRREVGPAAGQVEPTNGG